MSKIIIVYMDGSLRLIQAPPGSTIEIHDYDHVLCNGAELPIERDENDEPFETYTLSR